MKKYSWSKEAKENICGEGNPFFGKKHTNKTKKLMKKKARQRIKEGKNKTMFKKGQHPSLKTEFKKGHESPKEWNKFKSRGEEHYNWRGGVAYEPYGPEFNQKLKNKIRMRDNHTCQLCGDKILKQTKKRFITVHHIDYCKKNNNLFNLIALCNFCNSSVNKSREQWTNHFQNKIGVIYNGYS